MYRRQKWFFIVDVPATDLDKTKSVLGLGEICAHRGQSAPGSGGVFGSVERQRSGEGSRTGAAIGT